MLQEQQVCMCSSVYALYVTQTILGGTWEQLWSCMEYEPYRYDLGVASKVYEHSHKQCRFELWTFIKFHQHRYKHTCTCAALFRSEVTTRVKQSKCVPHCVAILVSKLIHRWCWSIAFAAWCMQVYTLGHTILTNVVPRMPGIQKRRFHCTAQRPMCLDGNIKKAKSQNDYNDQL